MADPGVTVTLEEADVCPQALTEEATLRVVRYLLLVPNGIAAMSMDIPGLVQTSCNLGICLLYTSSRGSSSGCSARNRRFIMSLPC